MRRRDVGLEACGVKVGDARSRNASYECRYGWIAWDMEREQIAVHGTATSGCAAHIIHTGRLAMLREHVRRACPCRAVIGARGEIREDAKARICSGCHGDVVLPRARTERVRRDVQFAGATRVRGTPAAQRSVARCTASSLPSALYLRRPRTARCLRAALEHLPQHLTGAMLVSGSASQHQDASRYRAYVPALRLLAPSAENAAVDAQRRSVRLAGPVRCRAHGGNRGGGTGTPDVHFHR